MAKFNKTIGSYTRIPYNSFLWKFGTTSFRTKEFNKKTEWQLELLKEFWEQPENSDQGWEKKYMAEGQNDIYEIKNKYYDWLVEHGFTRGDDSVKYKAAREKTSGLYDMGLINENHRLSPVGKELLELTKKDDFIEKTKLNISKDSQLYLSQLLKLSTDDAEGTVRPLIVVLYLLSKLEYLTNDEFKYLMPLCTSEQNTEYILECIHKLRNGVGSIDEIIKNFLICKKNYTEGLHRFCQQPFTPDLLLSVGMNRKSVNYDKSYIPLYENMYCVYIEKDSSKIVSLFQSIRAIKNSSIAIKWKNLLFDTYNFKSVKDNPEEHLIQLEDNILTSEEDFKRYFFLTMHLFKAKATLEDYLDLNRRYLGLTNCFLFEDGIVKLDIVPKQVFANAIEELYKQAYEKCDLLFENCTLESICPALKFNEDEVIDGINKELGTDINSITEVYDEVDKVRYDRFNKLIDDKFSDKNLLLLLDNFDNRIDSEINRMVTDNADIPTIFEYVLGIIWYKVSGRRGKILDYLKLSLDSSLLPITHAAGGEADIVYEYQECEDYPQHSLLLEATLADGTNQRRMEMEPVSRHLGNHLIRTGNLNSYCVFATSYLHINVIGDFRSRRNVTYCDPLDYNKFVDGMKIIPLETSDLRRMLECSIPYKKLYKHFDNAYNSNQGHPKKWYEDHVKIENSDYLNAMSSTYTVESYNDKIEYYEEAQQAAESDKKLSEEKINQILKLSIKQWLGYNPQLVFTKKRYWECIYRVASDHGLTIDGDNNYFVDKIKSFGFEKIPPIDIDLMDRLHKGIYTKSLEEWTSVNLKDNDLLIYEDMYNIAHQFDMIVKSNLENYLSRR